MTRHSAYASRRAFTILEGLTVAGVIILLLSLALVAATRAMRHAKIASEGHHLSSMKIAMEQFKTDFGLPPLVDDVTNFSPVNMSTGQPYIIPARPSGAGVTAMSEWTRGSDPRVQYSIHSIPYYLMGLLDVEHNGEPIDGAAGPAITKLDNGRFTRRGAPVSAVFTGGEDSRRIKRDLTSTSFDAKVRIAYVDQWGLQDEWPSPSAIRYYRWERNPTNGDPNLPAAVGKVRQVGSEWVIEDVELRAAKYAIVSAGPDAQIDDTDPDAEVNKDNIVEVGK